MTMQCTTKQRRRIKPANIRRIHTRDVISLNVFELYAREFASDRCRCHTNHTHHTDHQPHTHKPDILFVLTPLRGDVGVIYQNPRLRRRATRIYRVQQDTHDNDALNTKQVQTTIYQSKTDDETN